MSTDTPRGSESTPATQDTVLDSRREVVAQPSAAPLRTLHFGERYHVAEVLGAGGMGEVRLARDHIIGRDVAMKVIRDGRGVVDANLLARFLREARVQGQLEHPAIVPVYDLGVDPEGGVYFTMKRVRGLSLEEILQGLRRGDPELTAKYTRRRLLTAFRSVCLAVDFAHARSVLHRDLKPSNVMLGDFGEVYLLDWGIAKIVGVDEPSPTSAVDLSTVDLSTVDAAATIAGSVLGTPGYMSPEQIRAENDALDARTDVYALGAVLFEILTLEPLHGQSSIVKRVLATLNGGDDRPSERRPEAKIPEELDALCIRATARELGERTRSARELSDAIEDFLDGDRNHELRRVAAAGHAERASEALKRSREAGRDEPAERSEAMREVSAALGLDPTNAAGLRTLVTLLTEVPRETPPEAKAELEASSQAIQRTVVSWGFAAYLPYALFLPFLIWMGVRDWTAIALNALFVTIAAVCSLIAGRMPVVPEIARVIIVGFSCLGIFWSSLVFGPFVLTPMFALSHTIALLFATDARLRGLSIAIGCASMTAPYVATRLGWWPESYRLHDGLITIVPNAVNFSSSATVGYLLFSNVLVIFLGGFLAARFRDLLAASEMRRQLQSWQLKQAIPAEARALTQ